MSTAPLARELQAPTDDQDWGFDYARAPWLEPGDAIASSDWAVSPTGPTLHDKGSDQTTTTVWVTGGSVGTTYTLTNTIVTTHNPPRTIARSFTLTVV